MKKAQYLVLPCLLLVSGCVTPPPDQSDKLEVAPPVGWTALPPDADITFRDGWLLDFGDSRLRMLVDEALRQNYNLRAAAARLEAARATATVSGADRWPQVSGTLDGSRRTRTGSGGFAITSSRSDSFNLALNLSWELDIWGKLRNAHQAGIADWQASQEDYRAARLSLAAGTARAWFNVLEAELQVQLAEHTVKSFEANLATIEERFRKGISSALDVRLTRANVAGARNSLNLRLRQRDAAVRVLEVILGRYPEDGLEVAEVLPVIKRVVPAGLPSGLLERRPDIVAAERRLAASDRRAAAARKSLLPSIRLTASGGTSTDEFDELLNSDFKVWSLASGLTQPIFQGKRLKANVERSRANYEEALADYTQTALTAFREVESTLAAERYLTEQEKALKLSVEESVGAEELAWDNYQAGLSDIITVLESQRRSFDSQRQLLSIANERLQNRIDLYLALGGAFDLGNGDVIDEPYSEQDEAPSVNE